MRGRAKYILRLDDASPAMHREKWAQAEALLDYFDIRPIVAVVPDNRDPQLVFSEVDPNFWSKVRGWQNKGWVIAMHGYQHVLHVSRRNLISRYSFSEFSGLSLDEQRLKIRKSWEIFSREGVIPTVWVAPMHGFDRTTLEALKMETTIRVVSDGYALDPYFEFGVDWIPQQLWGFIDMPFGLFTVCLHPNTWDWSTIGKLCKKISKRREVMVDLTNLAVTRTRSRTERRLAGMVPMSIRCFSRIKQALF